MLLDLLPLFDDVLVMPVTPFPEATPYVEHTYTLRRPGHDGDKPVKTPESIHSSVFQPWKGSLHFH
jgi:hypothetical protein